MKKIAVLSVLCALLGGCTEDTRVLVGDVTDHVSNDLLDTIFGVLFPSSDLSAAQAEPTAAPESQP